MRVVIASRHRLKERSLSKPVEGIGKISVSTLLVASTECFLRLVRQAQTPFSTLQFSGRTGCRFACFIGAASYYPTCLWSCWPHK